jgi:NDP-sugar pyrophosphorylase family protein
MKAFVLAAGESRRLRPLTDRVPKPMLHIGRRPILEHNIRLLAAYGVHDIVINLHHCPEAVRQHFGDGSRFGVSIRYSYEPELLGTAGALKPFQDYFAESFFLLYGDNLTTCKLDLLLERHRQRHALATIAVFQRSDVASSGVVEFAPDGRVHRFVEKPKPSETSGNWVNAGIAVLEPAVIGLIPAGVPADFGRDVFPSLLERGEPVYAYPMSEQLWWIDSPADYARTLSEGDAIETMIAGSGRPGLRA